MPARKKYTLVENRTQYKKWAYAGGHVILTYNYGMASWSVFHNENIVRANMKRKRIANALAERTVSRASRRQ